MNDRPGHGFVDGIAPGLPVGALYGGPCLVRREWAMLGELRVQLSEDGADAERLDGLSSFLRQELLQVDVGPD